MIRFHLDEHVPPAVADGLRQHGVDVTTTLDAGLASATDEQQLEHARLESRVFVTSDADFLRLHARGMSHSGVAYYHHGTRSIGELVDSLTVLHGCLTPPEMENQVEFL